jgi:hypothetical protein
MMYVGMVGLYRTSGLLVGALGAVATPAAVPSPVLERPLAACYVSVDAEHREPVAVAATGFTGGALVDASVDGRLQTPAGVLADGEGRVSGEVPAPYQATGQRRFRLDLVERGNPANAIAVRSRVTALAVTVRPQRARPGAAVRYRGRGFLDPGAVYAHYVLDGQVRRTVRLAVPHGPCGTFAVRARQIPVRRPATGIWTVQLDQSRRYDGELDPVYVRLTIAVRRAAA